VVCHSPDVMLPLEVRMVGRFGQRLAEPSQFRMWPSCSSTCLRSEEKRGFCQDPNGPFS
jgi:hypothetical protein